MTNCIAKTVFILLLFISTQVFSQEPVRFTNGNFVTGNNVARQTFRKEGISNALFEKEYYVVIQFSTLPTLTTQQNLLKVGIKLSNYLPGKAFLAAIPSDFDFSGAAQFNIVSISSVPAFYKTDQRLLQPAGGAAKDPPHNVAVDFYNNVSRHKAVEQLKKAGATIVSTRYDASGVIFIERDTAVMRRVAELPFVSSLYIQSINDKALNYKNVATHGLSSLQSIAGKNLNGRGVTVGIGDNADISSHVDFTGRLINRSPGLITDHGTHVSGTAAGGGIINVKNHGMAPQSTVISQFFSDIIINAPAYVSDNHMVVTNNSYYSVEAGCAGNGKYDVLSSFIDRQMGNYSRLLHVAASGNDGASSCASYLPGFGTVKSGWQTAKNVLTVGAINTNDYEIAYFSSRGPVKDGRIKPEISAGGWAILSSNANNTYGVNFGTSMSSPVVAGTVALLYERYRQRNGGADPKSSLVKAIACNTAEDLGNPGPDYTFGFGMINGRRAVEAIDSNRYIINSVAQGANGVHSINVPANARRLKIMLYWADKEAAVNAATALVNDLDLTVSAPSTLVHHPLILNPAAGNVNDVAVEGVDHLNNIEQVVINNPSAGNYNIRVEGFLVPSGSQEYIISYEVDRSSVVVEYPAGGEKLVPGEIENIRWTAYGDEANKFTVQYSPDNGASWAVISDTVAATARTISWKVPDAFTNTALIRVSRNGSGLTDASDFNFTVLGSPLLVATNPCVGAIQLNWNKINGATSYNVLQLIGDSMQVIANTMDTTFLVTGLDKYKRTWLGVTANNASVSGRRSLSAGITPNSGACTLPAFYNDLKVDSILEPLSARMGYSNALNATRPVKVLLRNTGDIASTGTFNISFSYDGNVVTEVFTGTVPASATLEYVFTNMYVIPAGGYRYEFKAWITSVADPNHLNDTASKVVKYINNDPIASLPLTEGFETMSNDNFSTAEMAIGENKHFDFSASSRRGRARSFVNTGFSYSGTRALTLDQAPYSNMTTRDSLTISYNLVNYVGKQLRLDFYYRNHGQDTAGFNKIWVRGSEADAWVPAYDLYAKQAGIGEWAHGNINLNEVLENAVPAQTVTATCQFRIGQEGFNSTNSARTVIDIDDGYTFDELVLNEVLNDVAMLRINSPALNDCALSSTNSISVQLKNYNNATLNNLAVSYQVNGGVVVTETIGSLEPNQTLDYVFTTKADLSAYIDYAINVWVKYPTDSYANNDSVLNYKVHNSPVITSFPYLQGFETGNGFFYAKGTNSTWTWGTPTKLLISKAANGAKAWVTNLGGNYKDNENSYLYTPCFNLAGLTQPMLSFSHVFQVEQDYDYTWAEYSTDGATWQKLGTGGAGTNWYDSTPANTWIKSNTRWHVATIPLPAGATSLKIRFVMNSDGGLTEEGIGIDDVHVFDKAAVYEGVPVTNLEQPVNGSGWVHFSTDGKRVASLNANGANLGSTTVQVHPRLGAVANSNGVFYLNRNLVVKPSNALTRPVSVRFYFTEAEVKSLLAANSCQYCAKPLDAYELAVTKYSSSQGDENGDLMDDSTGFFQFISADSTTIIPYDNGYYAEFNVHSFSEFWLGSEFIKPSVNGVCLGDNIVFIASGTGSSYQWQEDNGSGFVNISNNVHYSGTTTATLQISNYATSISVNKYRCLVNGVPGKVNTIRIVNVWTGGTNTDWFTTSNWSCGYIPDQYTDVMIPGGLLHYPVVNAATSVKSVRGFPGASCTLGTGVILDIKGK